MKQSARCPWIVLAGLGWGLVWPEFALARSPHQEVVSFQVVSNTAVGRSVYVVGSHPEVGSWNPVDAIRLIYHSGNIWSGQVAVQSGTALEYKFISRDDAAAQHCNGANVHWAGGDNLATNIAAQTPAPYPGKTLFYLSGWTNVVLVYSTNGVSFQNAPMTRLGPGRAGGEFLYFVNNIGEAGEGLQFIPSDGGTNYDHAPYPGYGGGDYYSKLDVMFLQDGQVYSYRPAAAVSASRIDATNVGSSYASIPARGIRIYLPRGYDQHTWKRYPVLYMHDGQNVFDPGGAFGSWGAEHALDREISQGRVRECIVVGVNNSANRLGEYCPPGDTAAGSPGIADRYADFLLHNVKPTVDAHYRTLMDGRETATLGSSMGGLVSLYLGLRTNGFKKIGVMSPAFWTAPRFTGWVSSNDTAGLRVYMDIGTGNEVGYVDDVWEVRQSLKKDGYPDHRDLLTVIGCGADHNEAAWSNRLAGALQFLMPPGDELNRLALASYPPALRSWTSAGGLLTVTADSLKGSITVLERGSAITSSGWTAVATGSLEALPWTQIQLVAPEDPFAQASFYRTSTSGSWNP